MNLNVPVLDLSGVIAMLAAMGGVTGLLAMLRLLFLDRLIQSLDSSQQNIVLRTVLVVLNFGAIIGLAVLMGATFDRSLITSAVLATLGASAGAHLVFTGVKSTVIPSGFTAGAKVEAPVAPDPTPATPAA